LFFDKFLGRIMNGCQNWELRVWARDILSPSPLLKRFLAEEVKPKLKVVGGIVGQITGLPPGHPQIPQLVFTLMAPCLLMLVIDKDTPTAFQPLFKIPPESLANHFSSFAKAGLDAVAQHYKD
jgi:hypothetical protein